LFRNTGFSDQKLAFIATGYAATPANMHCLVSVRTQLPNGTQTSNGCGP